VKIAFIAGHEWTGSRKETSLGIASHEPDHTAFHTQLTRTNCAHKIVKRTRFKLKKRLSEIMRLIPFFTFAILALTVPAALGQAIRPVPPDERFKADILLVVAHPDDETEVTGYLVRAVFDEHKRVAVIFGTRGDGGGNAAGHEQAAALGAEREIEARQALSVLGVTNIWFLGGPDTPGQDVLRSLETWNHGAALDQAVRLVRLTRPEVILTWLPVSVAGENHGDHQAAGVIATEAFDMAGDPTVFPEQLAAPRDRKNIGNLTEGLHPWQTKKIYYFSDATDAGFQSGQGPHYSTEDDSPSRKTPYYKIAAEEMSFHLTQDDTGQMAAAAIRKGDYTYFRQPVLLILGKSLVGGSITADIFEGISGNPIPFSPHPGYKAAQRSGISMELGGPWSFYREFWQAHGLLQLSGLLPEVGVNVVPGERIQIPLLLHNDSDAETVVTITANVPGGWTETSGGGPYLVPAHHDVSLYFKAKTAAADGKTAQKLTLAAETSGAGIPPITIVVYADRAALPQ
jgi:LmbE family N-acetylglucosaminyl deacetylase